MPGKRPEKPTNIDNSWGFVKGDFARVINNIYEGIDRKTFILSFIGLTFITVVVGISLYFALKPNEPQTMAGDFKIAIAGFSEIGTSGQNNLGYDLAESLRLRLEKDLEAINPDLVIMVWGPDKVGTIQENTPEERALEAEKIATNIHANLVIYGLVDMTVQEQWQVIPEFYISAENFYEANEIVGQYDMGEPISLPGLSNSAWQFEFGKSMFARGKALAAISVGLGYMAVHDYESALEILQTGEDIENWEESQGQKVLYTLIGLAAGKSGHYDIAEDVLLRAIEIDDEYARPYIGMANLNYIRAMQGFEISKQIQDIQPEFLDICLNYLEQAVSAPNKPPLADVETKIHFSRGQCYLAQVLAGKGVDLMPAIIEFEYVIEDFGDGANSRVRELAAESYARLGLVYNLTENYDQAATHYQLAADLLTDFPERREQYLQRASELKSKTISP